MDFANLQAIITNKKTTHEDKEIAFLQIISHSPDIASVFRSLNTLWPDISTARTTKIIKNILSQRESNIETLNLINELVNIYENKKLLKLDLEARRIEVLLNLKDFSECLTSIKGLIKELKKHNDKLNLINLHVCESKAYYELKNPTRAKSSLTSARALAVSTFCPAYMQAQIDMLSGMYICDEKNFETAASYFLESLDGFVMEKKKESIILLRYLILSKIIGGKYREIGLLKRKCEEKIAKTGLQTEDNIINLLISINESCLKRDLNSYKNILTNNNCIFEDSFISHHLNFLYDRLLEENLLKIIEPYSNVKIEYIAKCINLEEGFVESVIRKMILDGKVRGILDHVGRSLILFDEKKKEENHKIIELVDGLIEFTTKN